MQRLTKVSNILGYIFILIAGILFFLSSNSHADNYLSTTVFGQWATTAAESTSSSISYTLPNEPYQFYGTDGSYEHVDDDKPDPLMRADTVEILFIVALACFIIDSGVQLIFYYSTASEGEPGGMMARLTTSIL